jgi:VanZ family protein
MEIRGTIRRMWNIAAFFRAWGWSLLIMAVIFAFSSMPSNEIPRFGWVDFLVKKGGHMTGYALLAAANLRALQLDPGGHKTGGHKTGGQKTGGHKIRPYGLAFLMAVLYSATDEWHQSFVPGRHPTLTDIGIDALGAALGTWLLVWYQQKRAI